jgi:UPF0176 protein
VTDIFHDAFYRFVTIREPEATQDSLRALCERCGLLGTILLAHEGINGMLAGSAEALGVFRQTLEADPRFTGIHYKRTACSQPPFKRLKVLVKSEIVPLGIEGVDATQFRGIDVSPVRWRELLQQDDVVLIDNRNAFEYEIGHFKGALNPGVTNFREFAAYIEHHLAEWQDKRVAMYCTGGIRCEKTTAWLAAKGLNVYQLEGGILNFFAQILDAERDYEGDCFVFDDRVALDSNLNEIHPKSAREVKTMSE